MKSINTRSFTLCQLVVLLLTLCTVLCADRQIVTITSPKPGTTLKPGQQINVTWKVPSDAGFMNFTAELWSLSTIQAGFSNKIATIGHTDTRKASGQQYTIPWKVPMFNKQMKTSYFIAVYGNKLSKGPSYSWVYPWDDVFYGLANVYFA